MSRSVLQLYIGIAKTLMKHGPLSIQEIAPLLKAKPSSLSEPMNFLEKKGIIRKRGSKSTAYYSITKHGTEILRYFKIPTLTKATVEKP